MAPRRLHPAQRFQAPAGIMRGTPLKAVLNSQLIALVGESLADVLPTFDRKRFERQANQGLDQLEFNQRGQHIGQALSDQLPSSFAQVCEILVRSLGPELRGTQGHGLGVFYYLPHSCILAEGGTALLASPAVTSRESHHRSLATSELDFEAGLRAIYELTKRMTGEFCLRPFLVARREACLSRLTEWARDPNPHVRRLVSEGTRPRLPWAMRLKEFQQDPSFTLPLLELLKDDQELYVRRSVANHLADILKDHPAVTFEVCERWLTEVSSKQASAQQTAARCWMIRHAVRLPAKKGDAQAVALRERAK